MKAVIVVVLVALVAFAMADSAQSDAEFFKKIGKIVKKVAPIVKKGLQIYGKVKGMGILSEVSPKLDKIKSRVRDAKERVGKAKSKFGGLKERAEKAKGKINGLKERAEKAKGKFNKVRDAAKKFKLNKTEADFGFGMLAGLGAKLLASKLGKKGKKGGKKNKKAAEEQSDAEFLKKLKKWWDEKGKNYFNKAKDLYGKGKQIYDMFKKPKQTEEAAPEADTDATTNCGMAFQNGQQLGNKQCVLVQGKPVVVETAIAFEKMNAAAKAAGITLQVNSGFRTQKEQEYLYNCYKTKKCNNGNLAARPGYSNHQNGRAMDISCSNPKVFDWMRNNAAKFGFIRTVASENWHWELLPGRKCNSSVRYTCRT